MYIDNADNNNTEIKITVNRKQNAPIDQSSQGFRIGHCFVNKLISGIYSPLEIMYIDNADNNNTEIKITVDRK